MVKNLLLTTCFILLSFCLWTQVVSAADETWKPHDEANFCLAQPCTTQQCQDDCDQLCALCHEGTPPESSSVSSAWNSSGMEISDVYVTAAPVGTNNPQDSCQDCHTGHYFFGTNHPVEVAYPPATGSEEFISAPNGPYLLCSTQDDCTMSCVTCHKVHPQEELGNQVISLLRVTMEESALCLRCHLK